MTDDVDIRSGGAIAVDTDTLNQVAAGFTSVSDVIHDAVRTLLAETNRLTAAGIAGPAIRRGEDLAIHGLHLRAAADDLADALRRAATVYEIVELRARLAAALLDGDAAAENGIRGSLSSIALAHPLLYVNALAIESAWHTAGVSELMRQASVLGPFAVGTVLGLGELIAAYGHGRVRADAVLTGPRVPVAVALLGRPVAGSAPVSLAGVVDRMPRGDARVRVEKYTMTNGPPRFAVYITGTQSIDGEDEPWDMAANRQLYDGERSASYEATVQALRDAGAQPGDTVYAFGHSQGAMIAGHLALEEGYDVKALVTMGSPVSTEVGPDTLSVQLRHVDDPVVALADGGDAAPVGSESSFIAERIADPLAGPQDLGLAAHVLDGYRDTAASVDASTDPRVGALRDVFGELGAATSMEVYEFGAARSHVPGPGRFSPLGGASDAG